MKKKNTHTQSDDHYTEWQHNILMTGEKNHRPEKYRWNTNTNEREKPQTYRKQVYWIYINKSYLVRTVQTKQKHTNSTYRSIFLLLRNSTMAKWYGLSLFFEHSLLNLSNAVTTHTHGTHNVNIYANSKASEMRRKKEEDKRLFLF